jgi:hypothetical protein
MIFLGSLDDKTVEYPFGRKLHSTSTPMQHILHHALFGKDLIVVEEGFLLASDEAVNPSSVKPLLLKAVKSGLVKVSTREGDMHAFAAQRRTRQHAAPPENIAGSQYLSDLQNACESSNAFIDYPSDTIDELTFNRFVQLANSEFTLRLLDFCEVDLPKDFNSLYEKEYRVGNNGKQWTARSAWESIIKSLYGDQPEVIHSLMASANLERQILRAAAIASKNNVEMTIETGALTSPHALVSPIQRDISLPVGNKAIYPRVSMNILLKNIDVLFSALGNTDNALHHVRNLYVTLLGNKENQSIEALERAALHYELEIYSIMGHAPIEMNTAGNVVGTAGIGLVAGGITNALWQSYKNRPTKPIHSEKAMGKHTRREFLRAGVYCALYTGLSVFENKSGQMIESGIKYARTTWQEDLSDNFLQHLDQTSHSHQILKVNKEAFDELGL